MAINCKMMTHEKRSNILLLTQKTPLWLSQPLV